MLGLMLGCMLQVNVILGNYLMLRESIATSEETRKKSTAKQQLVNINSTYIQRTRSHAFAHKYLWEIILPIPELHASNGFSSSTESCFRFMNHLLLCSKLIRTSLKSNGGSINHSAGLIVLICPEQACCIKYTSGLWFQEFQGIVGG
jgi:hypothetical protein